MHLPEGWPWREAFNEFCRRVTTGGASPRGAAKSPGVGVDLGV